MTPSQAAQEKPTSPRTEAGRTLVQRMLSSKTDDRMGPDDLQRAILAIEREAAAATPSLDPDEDAVWAHVIREPETDEPTLLDDESLAVVNRALSIYGSSFRLERSWIRPGPIFARLDEGSATPDQGKGEPR